MDKRITKDGLATEYNRYNQAIVAANNQARIRELRLYATEGFVEVFNLVPHLLNVNRPGTPGYMPDADTPFGVKFIDRQLWLPQEEHQAVGLAISEHPVVESLFLIGSAGSVGHNASSDLDYWVCHEDGALAGKALRLFRQKLDAITAWAWEKYETEANFYLINLDSPRKRHLTRRDNSEINGKVAPLLLLDELYSTFLFVAGRHPLWPVLPLSTDEKQYKEICSSLAKNHDFEFVDLGFPNTPPPQELLATALWLARKSETDPFKGLLKIMAILDDVESGLTKKALCYKVKEEIFKRPEDAMPVDPYIVCINRVTEYGLAYLSQKQLDLLRMASVMKIIGFGNEQTAISIIQNSPKKLALSQWARKWNWSCDRMIHLINYNSWPARDQVQLGGAILNMLISVYIRIAQYLIKKYPEQINPQDYELAPLAARLLARMDGLDCTVETLPSRLHYLSIPNQLHLMTHSAPKNCWAIHALNGPDDCPNEQNIIYSCSRAAKAAAWLVHNRIYGSGKNLTINNFPFQAPTVERFKEFLELIQQAFPCFESRYNEPSNLWSLGGQGKIVLALNFELPDESNSTLATADIIIRVGQGELRHHLVTTETYSLLTNRYLKIIKTVLKEYGLNARQENLLFLQPQTPELYWAMMNIKDGLSAAAKHKRPDSSGKIRIDI